MLLRLLQPHPGQTLLDVGSGTGYFSRRFAAAGLRVTGVDPDREMLRYACALEDGVEYLEATALHLPFADQSFDYCAASLFHRRAGTGAGRDVARESTWWCWGC
ncbi:MAG: methyltransferase domain-containing protein [Gammaproteobacteria bacterium]|nr:methyltransferase domain-containing protein [Gammaproteobacteria bacterium]